jgi:hypothetical protein
MSGLSTDELRTAVRAVLRDLLPAAVLDAARTSSRVDDQVTAQEVVVLRTDADLDVFVRRLAALCADPARRAALHEGRHQFRLRAAASDAPATAGRTDGVLRVDRGAVTERTVTRAAADGVRLVLGKGAVLTPLAHDKVRSLGVAVEKERS